MKLAEAEALAKKLMEEHGLSDAWRFEFDNAVRRFGATSYGRTTISLSKKLTELNSEDKVRNTILHEIAHALVGHGEGHSHRWVQTAKSIGCDGNRLYSANSVVTPVGKYQATCPNCGRQVNRHKRVTNMACGVCCKKYNHNRYSAEYMFTWEVVKV